MDILTKLFRFPIIMIDGDNEERKMEKNKLMDKEEAEVDIIIGEAECPYYDFVSVTDRWLPTEESLEKALQGTFEACNVIFSQSGPFIVPWTRSKFKKELAKFIEKQPKQQELPISVLFSKDMEKIADSGK